VLNAIKHSKAEKINFFWGKQTNSFLLKVTDDGIGIKEENLPGKKGMGIIVMQSRAAAINAELKINKHSIKGTELCLKLKNELINSK
jgi:two-component system sensor histidine kinase DesK